MKGTIVIPEELLIYINEHPNININRLEFYAKSRHEELLKNIRDKNKARKYFKLFETVEEKDRKEFYYKNGYKFLPKIVEKIEKYMEFRNRLINERDKK